MKIRFNIDNNVIQGTLNNTAASKALWNSLPITVDFYPHQSREIYANIKLDKTGTLVDSYEIGDIAYWTPGETLVLYFGPGYTDSLIIMGKMTSDYSKLKQIKDKTSVVIEKVD